MKKNTIRNALTRVLWSTDRDEYEIIVVDRLAPGGIRAIRASCIARVDSAYLYVKCPGDAEETLIPIHRVIAITRKGVEAWSRYRRS